MTDPLDTFKLPSELTVLLSPADQEFVKSKIVDLHVRLVYERDPELEDNRGRGLHLKLLFDAIAEPLTTNVKSESERVQLVEHLIPKIVTQIRSDLSWYPHNPEEMPHFLAPLIKRWLYSPMVRRIRPAIQVEPDREPEAKQLLLPEQTVRANRGRPPLCGGNRNRQIARVAEGIPDWKRNLESVAEALDVSELKPAPQRVHEMA